MLNYLALLIEFLGTFIFFSVIIATGNPWAIGATLAVLIFLGSAISGGHFNPGVTAMFLYNRGITMENAAGYIVVQLAAAVLAATVYTQLKKGGVL